MTVSREWFDTDGLLDRFDAVQSLSELVAELAAGRGGCIFVVGDAGLGKTTLLRRTESMARSRSDAWGRRFVLGRTDGVLLGMSHAYRFTDQLFASLGSDGLGTFPTPGQGGSNRFLTATRTLEALSSEQPVLVSLDDMHLADSDSLALVEFVCRQVQGRRVGFLGSLRRLPSQAIELARRLEANGYASILELGPLDQGNSLDLFCARTWGDVTSSEIEAAAETCGGNPLFIEEVARSLLGGSKTPSIEPFSTGRRAILLRRFAGVSDETFRFVRAASVLGISFRPDVAARMIGFDGPMIDAALEEATVTGLLVSEDTSVRFVHPAFASGVYEGLQGPLRTEFHQAAFRSIWAVGGTTTQMAEHAVAGGLSDEIALAVIVEAGEECLVAGSWNEAIRFLSVAAADGRRSAVPGIQRMLGEALAGGGRPTEAITCLEALLARPEVEGVERGRSLTVLARAELACGMVESPLQRCEEAARILEPLDRSLAVDALLRGASIARFFIGARETLEYAERARALSEGLVEATRLQIDAAWGSGSLTLGRIEGFRVLERAVERIDSFGPPADDYVNREWWPLSWTVAAAAFVEDFDLAQHAFDLGFSAAERRGWPAPMGGYLVNEIDMLLRQGRTSESEFYLAKLEALSERAPVLGSAVTLLRARVDLVRGRIAESDIGCREFEQVLESRKVPAPWVRLWTLLMRATLQIAQGLAEDACSTIEKAEKVAEDTGFVEPCAAPWWNVGIICFGATKRFADLARIVEWLDSATADLPCHWPRAGAYSGRAFIAEGAGDTDAARDLHELSVAEMADTRMALAKAELLLRQGTFLRRAGDLRAARGALSNAHQIGEACDSELVTAVAAKELRRAGGRVRRSKRPDNGLTVRQSEIAELASKGFTNFEIANRLSIKRKTVEHHLEAVYATWGLNSRRELMSKVFSGEISFSSPDQPESNPAS